MEKVLYDQMCFLRNQSTWVVFLAAPSLIFAIFLGFWFFMTSSALFLSTVLFISSKNKPHVEENPSDPQPETESTAQDIDFLLRSSKGVFEEIETETEAELGFQDNVDHYSPDWSDGSISDEEGLIEIELPGGHYVDQSINVQPRKCQDLVAQSILQKHTLMELLAEINEMMEEDNLIEIDISMGSIKCSRIEIKA